LPASLAAKLTDVSFSMVYATTALVKTDDCKVWSTNQDIEIFARLRMSPNGYIYTQIDIRLSGEESGVVGAGTNNSLKIYKK
jgi:hypothetical protein